MDNLSQRDKSKQVRTVLMSRTFKPLPTSEDEELVKFTPVSNSKQQPSAQKRDDTLDRIYKMVDTGTAVLEHPLETLGRTVKAMAHEAHADWLEAGKRSKLAKKAYKETYAKRKSDVRWEKRQKAIEKAQADAIHKAETTVTERTLERAEKAINAGKKAAHVGFGGVKKGIRDAGEIVDEFESTPVARNLKAQVEADYRHMKSVGRRARESIAATGLGNNRHMTAASLNKPRVFGSNNKATITSQKAAKYKTRGLQPAKVKSTSSTITANSLGAQRHKSVSGLIKRNCGGIGANQKANSVLNITKIATVSGLTRKIHSGVV